MTDTDSNLITSDNAALDTENSSITEYDFKDYYIDAFISTSNKTDSYKKACKAIGYDYNKQYLSQAAYSYHKRLDKDGSITKALQAVIQRDSIESRLKLISLRDNARSEQVQLSAAVKTVGSLYDVAVAGAGIEVFVNRDNVQIKAGKDTLTIANSDD